MEINLVFILSIKLLSLGLIVKSLEFLYTINDFSEKSIFSWKIIGTDYLLHSKLNIFFKYIYSKNGMKILAVITIILSCSLLVFNSNYKGYNFILSVLLTINILYYLRQIYGVDGADQMLFLITIVLLLCYLIFNTIAIKKTGATFIAIQLLLSYFVAGIAKLVSNSWRSGSAIKGILSTNTYGSKFTRDILTKKNRINKAICWMVILIEIAFPVIIFIPHEYIFYFLGLGFILHLSIAIIMGLNDFIWGFIAAYPFLYYVCLNI
ncbi:MAG: hypothetical protein ACI87N_003544 [Flavobacteriales bacterium]|jgi:hypothetical protein